MKNLRILWPFILGALAFAGGLALTLLPAPAQAADLAYDVLLSQRKDDNSSATQRNVAGVAGGVFGFDASKHPISYTYAQLVTNAGLLTSSAAAGLYVLQTTQVNGHALSGNVTVSASDLTTGTLPNARISALPNANLANSTISIAGTSTALGGSITQDTITGLGTTGLVKRTGLNALAIATSGTDYAPATSGGSILYGNGSGGFSSVTVGGNLSFTAGTLNTIQGIRTSDSPTFAAVTSAQAALATFTGFWNANASDVTDVDRAAFRFSALNATGTQRTWGIYGYSTNLAAGHFSGGTRFTVVNNVTTVETEAGRFTQSGGLNIGGTADVTAGGLTTSGSVSFANFITFTGTTPGSASVPWAGTSGSTDWFMNAPTGKTVILGINNVSQLTVSGTATTVAGNAFLGSDGTSSVTRAGLNGAGFAAVFNITSDAKTAADGIILNLNAQNASSAAKTYGQIGASIVSPTAGSENGSVFIRSITSGAQTLAATFTSALTTVAGNLAVSGGGTSSFASITNPSSASTGALVVGNGINGGIGAASAYFNALTIQGTGSITFAAGGTGTILTSGYSAALNLEGSVVNVGLGSGATLAAKGNLTVAGNLTIANTSAIKGVRTATATLDFPSTGAAAVADLTVTVTGAAVNDVAKVGPPNGSVTATATYSAWVSAADTVTVRFSPKATEDPPSGTFRVVVMSF